MSFIKIGETTTIRSSDIKSTDEVLTTLNTSAIDQFAKTAKELRRIAPKAKDFLYFETVMMHSAEANLVDEKGNIKKDANGKDVESRWDIDKKTGGWKWVCSDKNIKPYANSNGDIFPESELKLAYKKWVGRPLCVDHKSSSVDHVRGVIVDTYYDDKLKRIIALCAADRIGYPDLCRKIETGVSNQTSMGVGCAEAHCGMDGCHKVARTEKDFCEHMKNKTGCGEINIGLSPIEISVVNQAADKKAIIYSILKSAEAIDRYLNSKETLITNSSLSSSDFSQLEKDLEKAQESLNKLKEGLSEFKEKEEDDSEEETESAKEDNNDAGVENMAETDLENTDRTFSVPARFATENDLDSSDQKIIIAKLDDLEEKINNFINKLASIEKPNNFSEETDMVNEKKAYFQGAGDVNEPTPGKPKYPKEDNESIREKEDKQMLAQTTGPVDGLFPGDEAKKKELQRAAEVEQRAIRRQAALNSAKEALKNKKAYFQGGGDANEPTPGKAKYPKEDNDKIRDKEDKHMTGASPFPSVGKVDGLYGDDLKKKELLNRASLVARFIKAANSDGSDNAANSGWQVYSKTDAGERLILTATVGDIAGDRAALMYGSIATKEFGKNIISTIKSEGFEKAVTMIKGAQSAGLTPVHSNPPAQPSKEEVDAAEGYAVLHNGAYPAEFVSKFPTYRAGMKTTAQAVPAMPSAGPGAAPDAAMTPELPADDKGNAGDPIDQVDSLIGEMDGLTADMKKAVDALKEEDTSDLDASAKPAATASVSSANMRKTLNGALQKGAKQAIAEMHDHIEELNLIKHVHQKSATINKDDAEFVATVISDAISDAKTTTANVYKLMSAFVKYARGTDALIKKATEEAKMNKSAQDAGNPNEDWKKTIEDLKKANPAPKPEDKFEAKPAPQDPAKPATPPPIFEADDSNDVVSFEVSPDGKMTGTADKLSDVKASEDLNTPEGRAVMRAKIAQKGLKFSDMLGKAHPKGGVMVPGLDSKPTGDLAKVEDLEEIHDKMLGIAEIVTPKVRQAAEQIQKLVVAGRINPETDFDGLVAQGLDSAAVSYWKKFWGEAKDGGSQFASELVKSVEKKKMAEEAEKARVKTARAYELAHDMVERGMIGSNREAITEQVNDILTWNDASFDSFKKVIANSKSQVKTAGLLPVVGSPRDSMLGGEDLVLPGVSNSNGDLKTLLESAFATSGRNKH